MSRRLSADARSAYRWRNMRTRAVDPAPVRTTRIEPNADLIGEDGEIDVARVPWWWVPARADSECVLCGAKVGHGNLVAWTARLGWTLCAACTAGADLTPRTSKRAHEQSAEQGGSD